MGGPGGGAPRKKFPDYVEKTCWDIYVKKGGFRQRSHIPCCFYKIDFSDNSLENKTFRDVLGCLGYL